MATGLIARIGGWSFRRPWWALAIWLVVMTGGVLAAGPVFSGLKDNNGPQSLESVRAGTVLDQGSTEGGTLVGLVDGVDPTATSVTTDVGAAAVDLTAIAGVRSVLTPYTPGVPAPQARTLLSADGKALLIRVVLDDLGDPAQQTAIAAVDNRLASSPARWWRTVSRPKATLGGEPVINDQANNQAQTDLSRAEELSLPITLIDPGLRLRRHRSAALPAGARRDRVDVGSMVGAAASSRSSPRSTRTPSPW